jgi:hypothetical protein
MKLNCTTVERRETRDQGQKRIPLSTLDPRRSPRSGVALIITLILLAVVTFMALTFLAISRRERNAVTATTDSVTAQLAADDALAAAEGQIVANMLATTNPYNFGLLVSTNYINPIGFVLNVASPTNVNYFYPNGNPVTGPDFLQNLANLYYLPRVPVYMSNLVTGTMEHRFYLDLNRNGTNEPNGLVPEIGPNGGFIHPNGTEDSINQNVVSNYHAGDPEWVGVLQHPDQPYGPNNPFVARYAFIALPIGNALDLNAVHNQVLDELGAPQGSVVSVNPSSAPVGPDTFLRNQGVGSWEINLAAFLADVNTNQWLSKLPPNGIYYQYNQPNNSGNQGKAFDDARALLAYRYQNNYLSLKTARLLFPIASGIRVFPFDNIDSYSDGPLQFGPAPLDEVGVIANRDNPLRPWAGADNTNQYFDMQELFDAAKTAQGVPAAALTAGNDFPDHLLAAGGNPTTPNSTYNRYTYYRLLSQMGVDSAPQQNRLNLNYVNVDASGNIVPGMETNLIPWANALQFFTNAADRMLRAYSQQWLVESPSNYVATYGMFTNLGTFANPTNIPIPFGISDIPVYVNGTNAYTPAIQRVLQLAANIYDATTNSTFAQGANYPSVFRPIFERDSLGDVFIVGYTSLSSTFGPNTVIGTGDQQLWIPYDLASITNNPSFPVFKPMTDVHGYINVYGVPWIIGAKKGFPNFNEFSMQSIVQVTRKLELVRPTLTALPSEITTNQMYIFSVSNVFGVECWNSYTSNSLSGVVIWPRDTLSMTLTNDDGMVPVSFSVLAANITNLPAQWPGTIQPWALNSNPNNPDTNSFVIPLFTNVVMFTNLTYVYADRQFENTTNFPDIGIRPLPQFRLVTTNRLQVAMLAQDSSGAYHVIDYVQLAGPDSSRDLNAELQDVDPTGLKGLWNTNFSGIPPFATPNGVVNQISFSDNPQANGASALTINDDGTWRNPQGGGTVGEAIAAFDSFINQVVNGTKRGVGIDPNTGIRYTATNLQLVAQVPFTPTRTIFEYTTWQANDPLVHYMAGDLNYPSSLAPDYGVQPGTNQWNKAALAFPILPDLGRLNKRYQPWGMGPDPHNIADRDPLIYSSDDWDFPSYKFPSVGWLGRVHRGTPWQTVYLKSLDIMLSSSPPGVPVAEVNWMGTSHVLIVTNTNPWVGWTGDSGYDAVNTAPVQDRLLFDIFTTALNDNATRGQLSVNVGAGDPSPQAGLAAWSALFSGVLVLTNTANDSSLLNGALYFPRPSVQFTNLPINPAGPAAVNSALGQIVTNINLTRATFTNADGLAGSFEHVGDILAVPALTTASPFLKWNNTAQQQNGLNDELYEWLPEQVMSLLQVSDSPRYVIYSYGQALKPAPNGISTANLTLADKRSAFGMVTNYQVVAEAATRAVVRFNGTRLDLVSNDVVNANWIVVPSITNNNAVVEEFNVLPSN